VNSGDDYSGQGGIWRIPPNGEAEVWLRDDLITGTGDLLGFPIDTNGIQFYHGDLYVINTDQLTVVRVPVPYLLVLAVPLDDLRIPHCIQVRPHTKEPDLNRISTLAVRLPRLRHPQG